MAPEGNAEAAYFSAARRAMRCTPDAVSSGGGRPALAFFSLRATALWAAHQGTARRLHGLSWKGTSTAVAPPAGNPALKPTAAVLAESIDYGGCPLRNVRTGGKETWNLLGLPSCPSCCGSLAHLPLASMGRFTRRHPRSETLRGAREMKILAYGRHHLGARRLCTSSTADHRPGMRSLWLHPRNRGLRQLRDVLRPGAHVPRGQQQLDLQGRCRCGDKLLLKTLKEVLFTLSLDGDGTAAKPVDGRQDILGGFAPAEGLGACVAGIDIGRDFCLQLLVGLGERRA